MCVFGFGFLLKELSVFCVRETEKEPFCELCVWMAGGWARGLRFSGCCNAFFNRTFPVMALVGLALGRGRSGAEM